MAKQRKTYYDPKLDVLPIDRKATTQRVIDRMERIRLYRQFGHIRREHSVTASYEGSETQRSIVASQPTQNIAIHNVDTEQELEEWSKTLDEVMSRMRLQERELVEKSFLAFEPQFDYSVAMDMEISDWKFKKLKSTAIYNIAFAMRLEVLKKRG